MGELTINELWQFALKAVAVIGTLTVICKYIKVAITTAMKPVTQINEHITTIDNKIDVISGGLKSSLRQSILKSCEDYLTKGYCSLEQRKSLEQSYNDYEKLVGENGLVDDLVSKTMNLPFKKGN